MPRLQRQLMVQNNNKEQNKCAKEIHMEEVVNLVKKVRILYNDPDATDSDSSEDEDGIRGHENVVGCKRVVKEIVIRNSLRRTHSENCFQHVDNAEGIENKIVANEKMQGLKIDENKKLQRSSSIYEGVRKRKWGKFAAEIRDAFKGKRIWLGSYDNEVEAAKVYQAKKLEFDRLLMPEKNKNLNSSGTPTVENSGCNRSSSSLETNGLCSLPSPSSALDVSSSAPFVQVPGNLAKEPKRRKKMPDVYQSVSSRTRDQLILPLICQEHSPVEDDWLFCSNIGEQPISELLEKPSKHLSTVKEMVEWHPFMEGQSVSTIPSIEPILVTKNHLQFGPNARQLQVPEIIADPVMSPSICLELYFDENGNDLKQSGFKEVDLTYCRNSELEMEKLFYDLNEYTALDFPETDELPELDDNDLKWINEVLLLENEFCSQDLLPSSNCSLLSHWK